MTTWRAGMSLHQQPTFSPKEASRKPAVARRTWRTGWPGMTWPQTLAFSSSLAQPNDTRLLMPSCRRSGGRNGE